MLPTELLLPVVWVVTDLLRMGAPQQQQWQWQGLSRPRLRGSRMKLLLLLLVEIVACQALLRGLKWEPLHPGSSVSKKAPCEGCIGVWEWVDVQ
jgi:hypothetical protein